jgi:hypothetical protein
MTADPKQFRPSFVKDGHEVDNTPRNCRMCSNRLQPWVKYYCSGECIKAAKINQSYGNETA